jgi:ligand-binding sensor domain-containing protein/signal transduction histidine kinase
MKGKILIVFNKKYTNELIKIRKFHFLNRVFIILLFLNFIELVFSDVSFSQNRRIIFDRINTGNGLSQNTINCILQDRKGFIWIGTNYGLNRYDGYSFRQYKNISFDSNSISDNLITAIYEDKEGTIWVGTQNNCLNKMIKRNGVFKRYYSAWGDSKCIFGNRIVSITEDVNGMLWVATNVGINLLNIHSDTIINLSNYDQDFIDLEQNEVLALFKDRAGAMWISSYKELCKFEFENNSWKKTFKIDYKTQPDAYFITSITEDINGNIWCGSSNSGLFNIDVKSNTINHFKHELKNSASIICNSITALFCDKMGNLWIGTSIGLDLMNLQNKKLQHFIYNEYDPNCLADNYVKYIYEDNNRNIWIGGNSAGLSIYSVLKFRFPHEKKMSGNPNSLIDNFVKAFFEDKTGKLWVGTQNGLDVFDPFSGNYKHYLNYLDKHNNLSNNITSILEDRNGILWIGTNEAGLYRYDGKLSKMTVFMPKKYDEHAIIDNHISAIYEDAEGDIWIGTAYDGIEKYDHINNKFFHYKNNSEVQNYPNNNKIKAIYEDRSRIFWIGTDGGLIRFDRRKGISKLFSHSETDKKSLSNNQVTSICEDSSGNLWVGTMGGGLNKFNGNDTNFSNITSGNGLCSDVIYGLLTDNNGKIWISTNSGLACFDPLTYVIKNYDKRAGIQGNEFNPGACCKGRSGMLYFGGVNGFNYFYPEKNVELLNIQPVRFTAFRIHDKEMFFQKDLNELEKIQLSYDIDLFSIDFSALDFINPYNVQYEYILEGYNKNWVKCGNLHSITFTNLDIGEYIFRVKISDLERNVEVPVSSIKIVINPPIWRTWWAESALIIILIITIGWFIRHGYRKNQQKIQRIKENASQILNVLETERSRIARELHDSVIQNIMAAKFGVNLVGDQITGEMQQEITDIIQLLEDTSDQVRNISYNLYPMIQENINLITVLNELIKRFTRKNNIQIEVVNNWFYEIDSADIRFNLFRIIQESLNNIEKHSGATNVQIILHADEKFHEIRIIDNGKGFDINEIRKIDDGRIHYGIKSIEDRTKYIGAVLKIITAPGKGTEIIVKMQSNKKRFQKSKNNII